MTAPPEELRPVPPPARRPESFDAAALQYLDPLYGMAMRLTRNPARAQDLVQDTYVKAFRHWAKFEEGTNLKAWLFTILTNTFLNDIKKHRHDLRAVDYDEVEEFLLGAAVMDTDPVVRGERSVDAFLAEVVDQNVKRAIDDLREPFRTVFLLVDLEEFSYQEAADILGVQIGTIRSRLFRGRAFLAERLRAYAIESGVLPPTAGEPPAAAEAAE
jgi:RNA polymerase sigma-70 factor (ECF subfamily)